MMSVMLAVAAAVLLFPTADALTTGWVLARFAAVYDAVPSQELTLLWRIVLALTLFAVLCALLRGLFSALSLVLALFVVRRGRWE